MKISLAQINPIVGDLNQNSLKILDFIDIAKEQGSDLVVFPEMAICGYPPEDLLHKKHFVDDNIKALQSIAKKVVGIVVVIGFVDQDKDKNVFNAAAILQDKKIKDVYYKHELPNYGVFDEKRYFKAGSKNKVFSIKGKKVGISICEDIWGEKGVCQNQVKLGADLLLNISCSPFDMSKAKRREVLIKARAKQYKTDICYVNIVGGQDGLIFDGASFVVDRTGNIKATLASFEEDLLTVDISQKGRQSCAKKYSQMESIYKALVLGTHDYLIKNGFKKAVIGLSGGIDSALVALIAVDALGKDNVVGVSMPSIYSSKGTQSDAKKIADNLGIDFKEIPIKKLVKAYETTLLTDFKGLEPNIAEENIQARIRGNILMALSNKFGWIVLTTGNKSEMAVGYCTLYGDMSGGFAVIKDVSKTKVYELVEFRNKLGKNEIPKRVLTRAPSAELRSNQKDEDSLPPYDLLDHLLEEYIEKHKSYKEMCKNADPSIVKRVMQLVDQSEYKRRQSPPGNKISIRSFDKDWRLPITNRYKENN